MSETNQIAQIEIDQNLLDLLPKPKGIKIEIIPDGNYDIPQELDLSKFPPDEREAAMEARDFVDRYLKLPIISDNFPDTDSRTNWKTKTYLNRVRINGEVVADKFKTMFKGNKLASNRIYSLVGSISFFNEYLAENERADMQAIIDYSYDLNKRQLKGELNGPTTEARIQEIKQLSKHAVEVLKKFAKQPVLN